MDTTFTAQAEIVINTSPAKVWDALINPALIKQYLFGTEATSNWQVGSSITYKGVWEGKAYEDKGTILKLEPEKYLLSTYWSGFSGLPDLPENYNNVAYSLFAENGATRLTITQDNIKTEEGKNHSQANWQIVLNSLKKLLET